MRLLSEIIVFLGVPCAVLATGDIGDLWNLPLWLLGIAYTTIALILVAGIVVGIFGKVE